VGRAKIVRDAAYTYLVVYHLIRRLKLPLPRGENSPNSSFNPDPGPKIQKLDELKKLIGLKASRSRKVWEVGEKR